MHMHAYVRKNRRNDAVESNVDFEWWGYHKGCIPTKGQAPVPLDTATGEPDKTKGRWSAPFYECEETILEFETSVTQSG